MNLKTLQGKLLTSAAPVITFVMTIFILVPVFAPALGQLVLNFSG